MNKTLKKVLNGQRFWLSRYKKEMGGITKCDPLEIKRYETAIASLQLRIQAEKMAMNK